MLGPAGECIKHYGDAVCERRGGPLPTSRIGVGSSHMLVSIPVPVAYAQLAHSELLVA